MQFKKYTKQRNRSIQGLRSFKDTLPKNIKKVINKKGHIYSETLNNWKYIVGDNLFKICYTKSFKNSSKFGVSTLLIMVKRGHEIDLEYSKKDINKIAMSISGSSTKNKSPKKGVQHDKLYDKQYANEYFKLVLTEDEIKYVKECELIVCSGEEI